MKKFIGILIAFFIVFINDAESQSTVYLRADTVTVMKQNGSAELKIMNATRDSISGVLVNTGNGVTKFQKIRAINDSQFVVGTDTVKIKGKSTGGGGGGSYTFSNGLNESGGDVKLGGALTGTTTISGTPTLNLHTDKTSFDPEGTGVTLEVKKGISGYAALNWPANVSQISLIPGGGIGTWVSQILELKVEATGTTINNLSGTGTRMVVADPVGKLSTQTIPAGGSAQKGTPSYYSPSASLNSDFIIEATAIVIPLNTYAHGDTIEWGFLDNASAHNFSFYDSAYSIYNGGTFRVRYPNVKSVLSNMITPDESFASLGAIVGSSSGLNEMEIRAYRSTMFGITLTGNGTASWTINGQDQQGGNFSNSGYNNGNGATLFNINNNYFVDYSRATVNYNGLSSYRCRLLHSGLGIYNIGFQLLDDFGNPVTDYPTATDEVTISGFASFDKLMNLSYWAAENSYLSSFTNFWVRGVYEAWMVAQPESTTSITVRWQNYPSATSYKIYRSTTADFASPTLIYSGTANSYSDTGLSANTQYWYKMIAVVGGIDTFVTTFRTNTTL